METTLFDNPSMDHRIAQRLRALRVERGWSLDELAKLSAVSRATLSRLENAEVSPTASVLGKLASAFGLTISRLMRMVEDDFAPFVPRQAQALWIDPETGYRRRSLSPPAQSLAGEVLECELPAGTRIVYERSPRPGLEHHVVLLDGELAITLSGQTYRLKAGDCLRYQLFGSSIFETGKGNSARYILFIV